MFTIDRMDWHYGGEFPKNLPRENGGTHIGMYLAWIINNNLIGDLHLDDAADSVELVKNREMTGRDFLIQECDEKFWEEDLNDEGLQFTHFYYADENGMKQYIEDYVECFKPEKEIYNVENNWDNYDKISKILDQRYGEWKSINS